MTKNMTKEECEKLTNKYTERSFTFCRVYEDVIGWQDGDKGELIRLYHHSTDKLRPGIFDLWQAKNERTSEICDIWASEVYFEGKPLIIEQAERAIESSGDITHPIEIHCPICNSFVSQIYLDGHCMCDRCDKQFLYGLVDGKWYRYNMKGERRKIEFVNGNWGRSRTV